MTNWIFRKRNLHCKYFILLTYLKLTFCVLIKNEDGCPYTFDMENKLFQYAKPQICSTLLPDNYTVPPKLLGNQNWGEPDTSLPYKIRMTYTADDDTFLVKIESKESKAPLPISELFIESRRISRLGKLGKRVGFFESQQEFLGYCCENSKLQSLFHRPKVTGSSKVTMSLKWVPLSFKGSVIFRANVFASPKEWYANVTTKRYDIPPHALSQRHKVVRYKLVSRKNKKTTKDRGG